MNYLSVAETAKKWNISERSVRNYCAQERIPGAVLIGKTWQIPENAEKPARSNGKKTPVGVPSIRKVPQGGFCNST